MDQTTVLELHSTATLDFKGFGTNCAIYNFLFSDFICALYNLFDWAKSGFQCLCEKAKILTEGSKSVFSMGGPNREGAQISSSCCPSGMVWHVVHVRVVPPYELMWAAVKKSARWSDWKSMLGISCRSSSAWRSQVRLCAVSSSLGLPGCWGMAKTPTCTYSVHFTTWHTHASKCVSSLEYIERDHFHFLCRCPLGVLNSTVLRQRQRRL